MQRFARDFSWLFRSLGQTPEGPVSVPDRFETSVRPALDIFGSSRFLEWQALARGLTDTDTVNFTASVVPDGQIRYLFRGDAFHQVAGNRNVWFELFNPDDSSLVVALTDRVTVGQNVRTPMSTPLIVPAGWNVRARADSATGVGVTFQATSIFVEVPLGEYIAGLP